ncbi:uncharacterized protein [Miscanthus floridulus]|uniref:uncharacterized protein n=1 Tax=Miscanthus floridulus TaxID=154761 RepID=UPI003459DD36
MNVSSNGEIFSRKERRSNISSIINTLDKVYNLDWNSSASKNECTAAIGFKWMLNQKKDAALGNGGLGRLASCFLDSMATLNLPAWGYGLRYRYGLFKQHIAKEGQEEIAEDWLDKFSPWEIPRHDVVFPVRFFGHVEILPDGSWKWVGGEVLKALAYDVPIPGYKTKKMQSAFVFGKQKLLLKISTYFNSMMVNMSQLPNFMLEPNRRRKASKTEAAVFPLQCIASVAVRAPHEAAAPARGAAAPVWPGHRGVQGRGRAAQVLAPQRHQGRRLPSNGTAAKVKAVLVVSLKPEYYDKLHSVYYTNATATGEVVTVYQPSHDQDQHSEAREHNERTLAACSSYCDRLVTTGFSTFGYVAHSLAGLRPWLLMLPDRTTQRAAVAWLVSRVEQDLDPVVHLPFTRHCEDVDSGGGLKLFD